MGDGITPAEVWAMSWMVDDDSVERRLGQKTAGRKGVGSTAVAKIIEPGMEIIHAC